MTEDETNALKSKFAHEFLRAGRDADKAFAITVALLPDTASALRAAQSWPIDEFVQAEMSRIIGEQEDGNLAFLPDKAAAAKLAWDMANGYGDLSDKTKALELYSKMRNFMPKETGVQLNLTANRVMVTRDHGSDDEWQRKVREQQNRLKGEVTASAETKH